MSIPRTLVAAALALGMTGVVFAASEKESAPMPQTRGMQGMDPNLHNQPARDPHEGCVPNAEKTAQLQSHPMPDTKGMKGMDQKAHAVDCPQAQPVKADKPRHVHK